MENINARISLAVLSAAIAFFSAGSASCEPGIAYRQLEAAAADNAVVYDGLSARSSDMAALTGAAAAKVKKEFAVPAISSAIPAVSTAAPASSDEQEQAGENKESHPIRDFIAAARPVVKKALDNGDAFLKRSALSAKSAVSRVFAVVKDVAIYGGLGALTAYFMCGMVVSLPVMIPAAIATAALWVFVNL